jgi:ABC-type transport system involved in cytochrome c biogenesis permease subunit
MKDMSRFLPCFVLVLAICYLIGVAIPPADPENKPQRYGFARVPVLDSGRAKPIDTSARTFLMTISHRSTYVEQDKEGNTQTQPAVQLVLDAMSQGLIDRYQHYYIENAELLERLGLKPNESQRYQDTEFGNRLEKMEPEIKKVAEAPEKDRNEFQKALLALAKRYQIQNLIIQKMQEGLKKRPLLVEAKIFRIENDEVLSRLNLEPRSGFRYSVSEIASKKNFAQIHRGIKNAKAAGEKAELVDVKMRELAQQVEAYQALVTLDGIPLVPSLVKGGRWETLNDALYRAEETGGKSKATAALEILLIANATGDADLFNKSLDDYRTEALAGVEGQRNWSDWEVFFNDFAPFYQCTILYVFVFLLACASWLWLSDALRDSAFWLAVLTLGLHTAALTARIYMTGRPPVTNLYTSAVFIGWAGVLVGLIQELIFRNGLGLVVGSVLGAATGIIAHHLAATGDTMAVLEAVLDTNFWLATHVVVVTLGYMATYVAGLLGILFILRGVFTRTLDKESFKTVGQMIYGVICFATLLSFVGTVLGGIWADQSWGRFWGWDVKENGALIIVLWNALVLHARWAGMVQQRGMAVLSLGGNIVTTWSWFGVNMLGVGLHTYGRMDEAVFWLWFFVTTQMILIGIGVTPLRNWRSLQAPEDKETPRGKEGRKQRPVPALAGSTGITS